MLSSDAGRLHRFFSLIGGGMSDPTGADAQPTHLPKSADSVAEAGPSYACQISRHVPNIRSYIASRVRNRHDAEDLLQDTLLKSLRVSAVTPIENPLAYSLTVARTLVVDYWRRNQRSEITGLEQPPEGETPTLDEVHIQQQKAEYLQQILQQLPPLRRQVFMMRRVQGMSREEIAAQLDMNTEAVKKHISRAMLTIARAMEKGGY